MNIVYWQHKDVIDSFEIIKLPGFISYEYTNCIKHLIILYWAHRATSLQKKCIESQQFQK